MQIPFTLIQPPTTHNTPAFYLRYVPQKNPCYEDVVTAIEYWIHAANAEIDALNLDDEGWCQAVQNAKHYLFIADQLKAYLSETGCVYH